MHPSACGSSSWSCCNDADNEKMKKQDIKVSVIIPVYKTEAYLEQCVRSIINQSYPDLEIILVDDGSPDRCPAMCDAFAAQDSRVKVIHKENGGLSSARAAGIRSASSDYIMLVDSDDWIDQNTVSACVERARQDDADCVMFGYVREYEGNSFYTPLFETDFSYGVADSEKQVHRRIVGPLGAELAIPQRIDSLSSVCMKLYRADVARRGKIVSERDVGSSEDTVFNLYALDGCRISYLNQCFYHYRKTNTGSLTAQHKATLSEKWDKLYRVIEEYTVQSGREEYYRTPLLNRVACGMIGLGLNEVSDGSSIGEQAEKLRAILNKPLYREAFAQLDTTSCDARWKLFFFLCRKHMTRMLALLLRIMNHLRSRMAA